MSLDAPNKPYSLPASEGMDYLHLDDAQVISRTVPLQGVSWTITETLARQELSDPEWIDLTRLFRERNKHCRHGRDQTAKCIAGIARLYLREEHRWQQFHNEHRIDGPRRGPVSRSIFHPISRYLLGLGVGGDTDGTAVVMAAVLDEWYEHRDTITPDQIPEWIKGRGGIRRIYDERREHGDDQPAQTSAPKTRDVVNDLVYTKPTLAQRLIGYFRPTGRILDPCRGNGAFYDHFPDTRDWCEIRDGRNFLEWNDPVDWVITNPPWSKEPYRAISVHAFEIAENVVFLTRLHNAIGTYARHQDWRDCGHGLQEMIVLPWEDAGFPSEGFVLGAFYWQRGWTGSTKLTYWTDPPELNLNC
jgi:hypothetical protein